MVTPEMRRAAKAVNFGVVYGQSPFGLAAALGIEQDAAAKFIDSYFEGYPGIEKFCSQVLAECRKNGYAKTILGRRRAISGVRERRAAAKSGRTYRGQYGYPGFGGGFDQTGYDRDPSSAAERTPIGEDAIANPRRVDL